MCRIRYTVILECDVIMFFRDFINGLCRAGDDKGMHFSDVRRAHRFNSTRGDTLEGVFSKLKKEFRDLQLIVAVLDRGTSYSESDNYTCSSLHI